MTTLGDAVLHSDSEAEDADFVVESDEDMCKTPKRHLKRDEMDEDVPQATTDLIEKIWSEMLAEDAKARKPPTAPAQPAPLDTLLRDLQRRHPKQAKDTSKEGVWAQLRKYSNVVADDAQRTASAVEIKARIRTASKHASGSSTSAPEGLQAQAAMLDDAVRFAGEVVRVRRKADSGADGHLQSAKKPRQLGTGLEALDALTSGPAKEISALQMCSLNWNLHKDEAERADLRQHPLAGALERQDFIRRSTARAAARLRAAERAAARAAMRT